MGEEIELNEIIAKNILAFLNRVDTKGEEFNEMWKCKVALGNFLMKLEEKPAKKEKNG